MLQPNDEFLFTRQRHEADVMGLHYDIRLVHGDKAYSFATLKDMPKPGEIIAVYEQPVHTASYALSKKVIIPKGQYGAGVTTLDWVRKAIVAPHSTETSLVIFTKDGEKFLLKKAPTKENEKSWIFRNITGMGKSENPYLKKVETNLEKVAKQEKHTARDLAIGTIGTGIATGQADKILGYHKVYHGTSKDIDQKIQKEGFDPKMGGTGSAKYSNKFVSQSAGKVHVTKNKLLANLFGSKLMHRMQPGFDIDRSGKATFEDIKNSKVVTARVPHQSWRGFNADPDMPKPGGSRFDYDPKDSAHKNHAATTSKRISPKYVSGGEGSKGILNFVHKNHLKNYYRSADGMARGLKGAAIAGVGAAITGFAAHSLKKNHE